MTIELDEDDFNIFDLDIEIDNDLDTGIPLIHRDNKYYCGACGKRIPAKIKARYCHKCGRKIDKKSYKKDHLDE